MKISSLINIIWEFGPQHYPQHKINLFVSNLSCLLKVILFNAILSTNFEGLILQLQKKKKNTPRINKTYALIVSVSTFTKVKYG